MRQKELDGHVAYLWGRIALAFDERGKPKFTLQDARSVRAVLEELRKLRGKP